MSYSFQLRYIHVHVQCITPLLWATPVPMLVIVLFHEWFWAEMPQSFLSYNFMAHACTCTLFVLFRFWDCLHDENSSLSLKDHLYLTEDMTVTDMNYSAANGTVIVLSVYMYM